MVLLRSLRAVGAGGRYSVWLLAAFAGAIVLLVAANSDTIFMRRPALRTSSELFVVDDVEPVRSSSGAGNRDGHDETVVAVVRRISLQKFLNRTTSLRTLPSLRAAAASKRVASGQAPESSAARSASGVIAGETTADRAAPRGGAVSAAIGRSQLPPPADAAMPSDLTPVTSPADRAVVYIGFADPMTRLGNKMFQYASGLGLALRHSKAAVLVLADSEPARALMRMRSTFRMSRLPEIYTAPPSADPLRESGWGLYDAARFDEPSTFARSVYTQGYLQSWKYFGPVADRIRQEYALNAETESQVETFFRSAGIEKTLRIGVHVRRGDLVHRPHLYTVAPPGYLRKAVDYYQEKYGSRHNLSFVIATDDRAWVDDFAAQQLSSNVTVKLLNNSPELDMSILSRCNHSIITSGTFGWWSAWLAGGDVIYYKDFIQPQSPLYGGYSPADYYPPSWLGVG